LNKKDLYVFWNENSYLCDLVKKVINSNIFDTNIKTKESLSEMKKIILKHI
jgi:hypothetical protein